MKEVENMEELVQLDLDQVNKLLGVEAGRQLHTFINHSLLAQTGKKDSGREDIARVSERSVTTAASTKATGQPTSGQAESPETVQPIELEDESSD